MCVYVYMCVCVFSFRYACNNIKNRITNLRLKTMHHGSSTTVCSIDIRKKWFLKNNANRYHIKYRRNNKPNN